MTRTLTVAIAAALLLLAALVDGPLALRGYLIGWLLALAAAGGAGGWLMVHNLTRGRWGDAIRRPATAASLTMPLVAVAFVPVAIGVGHLFPWADATLVVESHPLQHRRIVFSPPFVIGRAFAFLALWSLLAWLLSRAGDAWRGRLSAGGLVLYFVTMSLASVDWIASREPDWYSSTFGFVTILGQATTGLALAIVAATLGRPERRPAPDVAHALGNLLQTVVVLWAYVSFAQYLVIWSGNSQEDNVWFVHRTTGAWLPIGVALIVGHFGLPFVMLLFQRAKRSPRTLGAITAFVLLMRFVDTLWTIVPSASGRGASQLRASDLVVPLAVAGLWWAVFDWRMSRRETREEVADVAAAA